ncbi:hypothetical protein [Umezawaea tangerina]|uniref:Uncharacterized protein n=1 Tax=Umezawaea tangerina TaxID=84725 RepID=A0A2T0TJS6_9PSEU|nr:hypothetical protein [Umezawaea tangerina]PRY45970.1 hypothetical protein CLV43_101234 [Umezawaea tangerina]
MPRPPKNDDESSHFSVRTTLLVLISGICAVSGGWLFHAGTQSVPLAVLAGAGAFVASWTFFDNLIR